MNHLYQKIHNIESVEKTKIYLFEKKKPKIYLKFNTLVYTVFRLDKDPW